MRLPFPAKNPQPDRVSDRENAALFLAASAPGCASAKATSPLKNRVGVFCRRASGRTGGARRPRRGIAPGCRARGYKPASGRAFDGNGNVIGYVDMATGNRSATYEYGAFGETIISDGPAVELFPFRFSTKYQDVETGFYYYGYRYYNPAIGRWLNREPIEEQGGVNLYVFIQNAPTDYTDYLGQFLQAAPQLAPFLQGVRPAPVTPLPVPVPITGSNPDATSQPYPFMSDTRWYVDGDSQSEPGGYLFRAMRGLFSPEVGESARTLGVRPGVDVEVNSGNVAQKNRAGIFQGMSVAPDTPYNLFVVRRPTEFGGSGKDPVWAIKRSLISDPNLQVIDDTPGHALVAPSKCIPYQEYKKSLETTRPLWKKVKTIKVPRYSTPSA
jgi:RHS repeat-associated protein